MAISRQRKNVSYGVGQPLYDLGPLPVSSTRNPTTSDMAELGTIWTNKSTNAAFVLASIASSSATWTPMTVNAGATITTGNLTVSAGDINVTLGDITAPAGNLTAGGDIQTTGGDLIVSTGNIDVTAGDIDADGDITTTSGDLIATTGDVLARSLFAGGDEGTGTATTTTFTNGTGGAVSTGAGVVLMTTANPGDSAGWLKIYVGTTVAYLPYWTNIAP